MPLKRRSLNTLKKTVEVLGDLGNIVEGADEQPMTNDELHEIPKSKLHGVDLKKIKAFRELRSNYKLDNERDIFLKDVQGILDHLPVEDHQFSVELLVQISNVAEQFYVYGTKKTRDNQKVETIRLLMLPYFMQDEKLLDTFLTLVKRFIVKSTRFTRTYRKIRNIFF